MFGSEPASLESGLLDNKDDYSLNCLTSKNLKYSASHKHVDSHIPPLEEDLASLSMASLFDSTFDSKRSDLASPSPKVGGPSQPVRIGRTVEDKQFENEELLGIFKAKMEAGLMKINEKFREDPKRTDKHRTMLLRTIKRVLSEVVGGIGINSYARS